MKITKWFVTFLIVGLVLSISLYPSIVQGLQKPAFLVGDAREAANQLEEAVRVQLNLPSRGAPGKRQDGAGRTIPSCPTVTKDMTALIPAGNIGLTVAEYPTFWFYIPYTAPPTRTIEFTLLDNEDKLVYETTFRFNGTSGIVSFPLPKVVTPLEVGKKYRWFLTYLCDPKKSSLNTHIYGYVERQELSPELASQLEAATEPIDKIALYAANGYWYETVNGLAELRLAEPNNQVWFDEWAHLLQLVDLDEIVEENLLY